MYELTAQGIRDIIRGPKPTNALPDSFQLESHDIFAGQPQLEQRDQVGVPRHHPEPGRHDAARHAQAARHQPDCRLRRLPPQEPGGINHFMIIGKTRPGVKKLLD